MIVYYNGSKAAAMPSHTVSICPARHLEGQEMPAEWVTEKNEPLDQYIEFKFGKAEVAKNVGEYMVKYGLASRTKLHMPDLVRA